MTSPGVDPIALSQTEAGVPWKGISFGLATAIIWGTWPVLSRFGVQQNLLAVDVAMLRFLVSGLIMLPLVLRRGHGGLGSRDETVDVAVGSAWGADRWPSQSESGTKIYPY